MVPANTPSLSLQHRERTEEANSLLRAWKQSENSPFRVLKYLSWTSESLLHSETIVGKHETFPDSSECLYVHWILDS